MYICHVKFMYFLFSKCVRTTIHRCLPCLYIALRQILTTNTETFSINSSLYCSLQTLTTNTVTFSISSSLYCPLSDPRNKHSNIQYQFLSILPSPVPHNNTVTFSISSSLYCSLQTLTTNTVTFSISSSLYCPPQSLTTTQ